MRSLFTAALVGALVLPFSSAHAIGRLVDVQVVDRDSGETLTPITWRGEWWIAGRPGARYAVTLVNRSGQRALGVLSVDGVNAITGDTASWSQSGYVLSPYERNQIAGWRKSMDRIAAFEFTALPDSYAARTGRPANVGVIGVAIFNERRRVVPPPLPSISSRDEDSRLMSRRAMPAPSQAPASSAGEANDAAPTTLRKSAEAELAANVPAAPRDRLGTGHGAIEDSSIRYVDFERLQDTPNEIVTIHYDRTENLIAMGILPSPKGSPVPVDAFPGSARFVPDPPVRR